MANKAKDEIILTE